MKKNVLVVAPHLDDEVLGCGGTIAKLAADNGYEVYVVVITKGYALQFSEIETEKTRENAKRAHVLLGVKETHYLDFPAANLDSVSHAKLNSRLISIFQQIKPVILFVPFNGDIHLDHQLVFNSSLVAARPNSAISIKTIYAYETLSETNWNASYITPNFVPNVFVDITKFLDKKLTAFRCFTDSGQVQKFPHERSLESLEYLSRLRGSQVFCEAAEAFVLVRAIL